jgi:hypothetical protein
MATQLTNHRKQASCPYRRSNEQIHRLSQRSQRLQVMSGHESIVERSAVKLYRFFDLKQEANVQRYLPRLLITQYGVRGDLG